MTVDNPCYLCERSYDDCASSCPRIEEYRARRLVPHVDRRAAYKLRHKQRGLCVTCAQPAVPGFIQCEVHRQKDRARRARLSVARRAHDCCPLCGNALTPVGDTGLATCSDCLAYRQRYREDHL